MMNIRTKAVADGFRKVDGVTTASPASGVVLSEPFEYQVDYLERLTERFKLGAQIIVWLAGQLIVLERDQTVLSWGMSEIMEKTVHMMWRIHSWTPHLSQLALRVRGAQVEGFIFHLENDFLARDKLEKWGQFELNSIFSGKLQMGKSPDDDCRNKEMRERVIQPLLRISKNQTPPGFNSGTHQRLIEFAREGFGGRDWCSANTTLVFHQHQ